MLLSPIVFLLFPLACARRAYVSCDTEQSGKDHFVNNDGVTLHYRQYGYGPPLVFIHGFPDNAGTWFSQVEMFSKDYTVITPTLRGFPPSGIPPNATDYTGAKYVSDLLAVLDDIGADTAVVAAHDVGGSIMQQFAFAYPEHLEGIILINTHVLPIFLPLIEFDAGQQNMSLYTLKYFAYEPGQPKNVSFITGKIRNERYRAEIAQYLEESPMYGMLDFYKENYPSPPYKQNLSTAGCVYKIPSLILWGTEDPYFSPKMIDGIEKYFLRGVRLVTVPGAGHWVFQDRATRSNREIGNFLEYLGY
ncbi:putative hydrolase [Leptodontidium sp. 2 PMI_412]|nr:putative hydrolase [Leptodontidium sp. 2 PMI_412]